MELFSIFIYFSVCSINQYCLRKQMEGSTAVTNSSITLPTQEAMASELLWVWIILEIWREIALCYSRWKVSWLYQVQNILQACCLLWKKKIYIYIQYIHIYIYLCVCAQVNVGVCLYYNTIQWAKPAKNKKTFSKWIIATFKAISKLCSKLLLLYEFLNKLIIPPKWLTNSKTDKFQTQLHYIVYK